ncbi:MAG TPA: penicillin-binding protein 2 [bacterium]|nr:penicillin-binding protein 2 [bacterium]HOL67627.1 penicillin-binding protein 2 [bacterium]
MNNIQSTSIDQIFLQRMEVTRRVFTFLFAVIFLGLVYRQVLRPAAAPGKIVRVEVPVARGRILDRTGTVLATSVPGYGLYLDYWEIRQQEKKEPEYLFRLKATLKQVLRMSDDQLEKVTRPPYPLVRRSLSLSEYEQLRKTGLPGLVFTQTHQRVYPFGPLAAHLIGFVGDEGEGLEGLELFYDSVLKGKDGLSMVPRDGQGRLIPSLEKVLARPEPGADLVLTVDFTFQSILEEELEKGQQLFQPLNITGIVMDASSGEILALANRPAYDPNCFFRVPGEYRRNKAVTDYFEPGSIFKIVTAAACLEEGRVHLGQPIFCENGRWYVRGHWLHDVHPYGTLTFEEVIIKSSNIGTVKLALMLGEETLYQYCRRFGFGELTGIDIPGEIPGVLRPVNDWSGYSITAVPIGQEVGINAIQGIRAMAALANGGFLVRPHVVKELRSGGNCTPLYREKEPARIISEKTTQVLSSILEKVASSEGTAARASLPGYRVCGKTGTAQKVINGRYSSRVVASFIGYLYHPEAKLVILVSVDEPRGAQYGGVVAAPIFRNILWRILQSRKLAPEGTDALQTITGVNGDRGRDRLLTKKRP